MAAYKGTRTRSTACSYAGETATINQARLDLATWLQANDLATVTDDAQLILSELISNAIEASPDQSYRVVAQIMPNAVAITVTNRSTAELPAEEDWTPKSVLAPQGRGLLIVNALSESVTIEQSGGATLVSARLRIAND